MKFYYVTNTFDPHILDKKWWPFSNFLKLAWKRVLFYFLDERNITTSLLMAYLNFSVAHYANLSYKSIYKPFLNYKPLNMPFRLFRFVIYVCFTKTFLKHFMKKLSFFNTEFQNLFQDVIYHRILGCQTMWY